MPNLKNILNLLEQKLQEVISNHLLKLVDLLHIHKDNVRGMFINVCNNMTHLFLVIWVMHTIGTITLKEKVIL